jgi:hypothetical protein
MPDWIAHALLALLICEIFGIRKKSLVLAGSILPDILKLASVLAPIQIETFWLYKFLFPLHTPIGSLILSGFIAALLDYDFRQAMKLLSIGFLSHFALDFFQTHIIYGETLLLMPFSWQNIELALIETDSYILVTLIICAAYISTLYLKRQKIFSTAPRNR